MSTPTVKIPCVVAARLQLVPKVIVTTFVCVGSEPVAVHPAPNDPVPLVVGVMLGVVVLVVNPVGNPTVIVLPEPSVPADELVKPHVHVEALLADRDVGTVPVTVTAEGELKSAPVDGFAGIRSALVETENSFAGNTPVLGSPKLPMTNEAVVEFATAQVEVRTM